MLDLQPIHLQGGHIAALGAFPLQAQAFRAVPHQSLQNRTARSRAGLLGQGLEQGEKALAIGILHRQGRHLGRSLGGGLAWAPFAKLDHLAQPNHVVGHLSEVRIRWVASAEGNGSPGCGQGGIGQHVAVLANGFGLDEGLARENEVRRMTPQFGRQGPLIEGVRRSRGGGRRGSRRLQGEQRENEEECRHEEPDDVAPAAPDEARFSMNPRPERWLRVLILPLCPLLSKIQDLVRNIFGCASDTLAWCNW